MDKKRKGRTVSVDFSGVESSNTVPNNDYKVRVADITEEEGEKAPYLNFKLEILEGKYKGKKLFHICSLSPASLWNLKATLEALGQKVPETIIQLEYMILKGLVMGVSTEIEKYKGKGRSKVVDVFSLEQMKDMEGVGEEKEEEEEEGEEREEGEDEEEEEEEEESPKGKKSKEDGDELGLKKMSLAQLNKIIEENEIEVNPKDKLDKEKLIKAITEYLNSD